MSVINFIPTIWSARLLAHLDKKHVYAALVNRDYEGEIKNYGDTVKINQIGDINIKDYTKGKDIDDPEDLSGEQTILTIDQAKYFNFAIDDVDKAQVNPKLMDAAMQRAEEAAALSGDTIQTSDDMGGLEDLLNDEIPEQEIYEEPEPETYEAPAELTQPETYEAPSEEPEQEAFETVEAFAEEAVSIPETETVQPVEEEPAAEITEADDTISGVIGEEEKTMDGLTQEQKQVEVNREAVDETAVVTEGMTITGDIMSRGSMELIGTVNGNLDIYGKLNITGTIQGDSKAAEIFAEGAKITGEVNSQGSVKIGQSSVVIGNIVAASAVIAGAVKGDIDVQGPVILDTTAIVMGNIKSKSVQINNGAVIEGLCSQCYADVNPSSFFEELKKKK